MVGIAAIVLVAINLGYPLALLGALGLALVRRVRR